MRRRTIGAPRLRTARPAHLLEVRDFLVVEQTDFAVDDETAAHLLQRQDDLRIPGRRVLLVASE